jgi:hypothetical protein
MVAKAPPAAFSFSMIGLGVAEGANKTDVVESKLPHRSNRLRHPHTLRPPLLQYSERDESNRHRIFRDVYLHWLLQEYFTSMDYNRGPSFLRRCLGSLDHVVEGKSRMVVFGARPWFRFAVIDDNLFPVAEASEIGRHQSGRFQASDLLAQCRNRQRSDSYADDENRRAGSIFSIECLPRCSW